jgi:hypothetical protein
LPISSPLPVNLPTPLRYRSSRLSLPVGALIALLQRNPAVQLVVSAVDYVTSSPAGALIRSGAATAASLGAIDALSGATTLVTSNNQSTLFVPAGSAIQPVIFGINNSINLGSWKVGGSIAPGLSLVAAEGGASLSGPGVLDATNKINSNTTPILQGTPTTAGSYTMTFQGFEFGGLQGLASGVFSYTVIVSGSSSGGTSGGGTSGGGSTSGGGPVILPPVPRVTVDGHSNGDIITLAAGASGLFQVTARYSATEGSKNLSGIRYNYWNPPSGNLTPFAGLFANGSSVFFPQSGSSGEVDQNVTLTPGDWYFWTDAQNSNGDSASTGAWTSGYVLHVVQGTGATSSTSPAPSTPAGDFPPTAIIAVDGRSNGDTISISKGGSATVTVRYTAIDSSNNLSGIRYNLWNPPAGNLTPFAGFFSNGNGFVPQAGGSGQVSQIVALTAGDWYFWTDAQNSNNDNTSTGAWSLGYVLHVVAQ